MNLTALGLWSGAELKAQNLNYDTNIINATKLQLL